MAWGTASCPKVVKAIPQFTNCRLVNNQAEKSRLHFVAYHLKQHIHYFMQQVYILILAAFS